MKYLHYLKIIIRICKLFSFFPRFHRDDFAELRLIQLLVDTVHGDQFLMFALFHDLSAGNDQDLVCLQDR